MKTAREIGLQHMTVETDELRNPSSISNSADRCYHCKQTLYRELRKIADRHGYDAILDATQTDDLSDHRPRLSPAAEERLPKPLPHSGCLEAGVRGTGPSRG